jgi:hypothetical protein
LQMYDFLFYLQNFRRFFCKKVKSPLPSRREV